MTHSFSFDILKVEVIYLLCMQNHCILLKNQF
ncbi:hypothetical protein HH_0803 [Helicobacter hepaticus ATCC 51449]|uniref:Uncharacterized protein n=1 Tax=Helicobacter hepaticus (strain ATCC 51449 / 3B1) TaxID=235279 RepID=Q7VI08_HELHP|nr:hypothetical protein HH_0803 [Helicobacter hepaticus ATCC 51449]